MPGLLAYAGRVRSCVGRDGERRRAGTRRHQRRSACPARIARPSRAANGHEDALWLTWTSLRSSTCRMTGPAIGIILADQVSVGVEKLYLFKIVHNYVKPAFLAEISANN